MCTSTSELKTVALVALFVCTHFKLMSYLDSEDVFFCFFIPAGYTEEVSFSVNSRSNRYYFHMRIFSIVMQLNKEFSCRC